MLLSDAFRIGGLDARCLARNHSGALVDDAASGQASDEALVRCPKRRRFRQRLPGRAARGRAAQEAGCEPRLLVIPAPGGSRPSWGAATGTQMLCAMWCATT